MVRCGNVAVFGFHGQLGAAELGVETRSHPQPMAARDAALRMESMQFVTIAPGTMRTYPRPNGDDASDRSV